MICPTEYVGIHRKFKLALFYLFSNFMQNSWMEVQSCNKATPISIKSEEKKAIEDMGVPSF